MKILVVGASQGTGALAAKLALSQGHEVTAFSRNPERLGLQHSKLRLVTGDFHQQASVDAAVLGHGAVIVTASSLTIKGFKATPDYFSRGTHYVIEAMRRHGVPRLVILSALGVGDSYSLLNPIAKFFIGYLLREPFTDHDRQERMARESGLQWVIARPNRLTDGPAQHKFVKQTEVKRVPGSIARADVAAFLLEAATSDTWVGKTVHLGG